LIKGLEIQYFIWYHWAHIEIHSVDAFSLFSGGVKLGSGAPSMWNLIQHICSDMVSNMTDEENTHGLQNFLNTVVVGKIAQFSPNGQSD
jgi:hypothetical protein